MSKQKLTTASKKKQPHMTPEQIKAKYKREREAKQLREKLQSEYPELYDAWLGNGELKPLEDLTGKKVKLNKDKYEQFFEREGNKIQEKFKQFCRENYDTEFVVKGKWKNNVYELKGNDWLFSYFDLIKVE